MLTALTDLEEALRGGREELCFEIDASATPSACFRSSNSSFLVPVPLEAAEALLEHIKNRACLDSSTPARSQSGVVPIGEQIFHVHCCPQVHGEIVVFRPYTAPHVPLAEPARVYPGASGAPRIKVHPKVYSAEEKLPVLSQHQIDAPSLGQSLRRFLRWLSAG